MTVIRIKDFPKLEAAILKAVFDIVKDTPKDGKWRLFKGRVKVKGRPYDMECLFLIDGTFFNIQKSQVKSEGNILIPYVNRIH